MKKTLTTIVMTAALGLGMLMGCDGRVTKKELSDILHEDAVVSTRVYTPSCTKTQVSPRLAKVGRGWGMGSHGVGPEFRGMVITSKKIPEQYKVVFDGEIDFETDNKEVYDRFNQGDNADVSYREVYKSTYQDKDEDGEKELVEKVKTGYEFVDAQPIKK